jgi:hypothetical protein
MLVREWTITEISFDARDCEKPYTRFETYIPFATKIEELGADGKVTRVRYKGGDQGKEEFDLIYLTIVKWRIEN